MLGIGKCRSNVPPKMCAHRQILVPTHEFSPRIGGIGVYLQETAYAASHLGHKVTVVAPSGLDDAVYPYQIRRISMNGTQDWVCRLKLRNYLKSHAFPRKETSMILGEPGPIRLWMYQDLLGLPSPAHLAIVFHGTELRILSSLPHRRYLLRRLLNKAHRIGVVSDWVKSELLSIYPEMESKTVKVPGSVRHSWQGREPAFPVYDQGKATILQVGRVHRRKGQAYLLNAMKYASQETLRRIRLVFIGPVRDFSYMREIESIRRDVGVEVDVRGELEELALREAYEKAYAVALPSQPYGKSVEGLGISLLEGSYFGKPVIGSEIGGIPDAMINGKTGFLFPINSPEQLANTISGLVEDMDLSKRLGQKGRAFVEANFSWQRNVELLLES